MKLRDVLESFAKNTSPQDDIMNNIRGANIDIGSIGGVALPVDRPGRKDPGINDSDAGDRTAQQAPLLPSVADPVFPDEFAFR
mmetsp:Transcript_24184/g.37210  ORF Transcript_24184/g.37210 Transcript_24184/m.37210 type:complete len:83 (+) Transcript_24184:1479-1727(+)